jgi:hypothetical protein
LSSLFGSWLGVGELLLELCYFGCDLSRLVRMIAVRDSIVLGFVLPSCCNLARWNLRSAGLEPQGSRINATWAGMPGRPRARSAQECNTGRRIGAQRHIGCRRENQKEKKEDLFRGKSTGKSRKSRAKSSTRQALLGLRPSHLPNCRPILRFVARASKGVETKVEMPRCWSWRAATWDKDTGLGNGTLSSVVH